MLKLAVGVWSQPARPPLTESTLVTPTVNLSVQLLMGLALLVGMVLARRKLFRAHGICQTAVVLLNLIPIASFMLPAFRTAVAPMLPAGLNERFYAVATIHAGLGITAEALGIYIVLVAGTKLLPTALRFTNYKPWMRTELVLWWLVIAFGLGTYFVWNVAGPAKLTKNDSTVVNSTLTATPKSTAPRTMTVTISNFAFEPKDLQINSSTTVIWKNTIGRHTVTADDGSFDSPIMAPGEEFRHTFDKQGSIRYFCKLHGAAGGQKMAGAVIVK